MLFPSTKREFWLTLQDRLMIQEAVRNVTDFYFICVGPPELCADPISTKTDYRTSSSSYIAFKIPENRPLFTNLFRFKVLICIPWSIIQETRYLPFAVSLCQCSVKGWFVGQRTLEDPKNRTRLVSFVERSHTPGLSGLFLARSPNVREFLLGVHASTGAPTRGTVAVLTEMSQHRASGQVKAWFARSKDWV